MAGRSSLHSTPTASRRRPLHPLVLDRDADRCPRRGLLRRVVRRPHVAPARRLSRDRDARLRRDRADRGAQLAHAHQRRDGTERRASAVPFRLLLRRQLEPLLLSRRAADRPADLRQLRGSRIRGSGAPGWRSARTRSRPGPWASTGSSSSCSPLPWVRPSRDAPAPSTSPSCRPRRPTCSCSRSRS